mgnify:CR=1 FL=1
MHARASAKLVELVEGFDADVEITKDRTTVSGDSIMGLLMLAASKGSKLKIKVTGVQKEKLLKEIENLVETNFGEDE